MYEFLEFVVVPDVPRPLLAARAFQCGAVGPFLGLQREARSCRNIAQLKDVGCVSVVVHCDEPPEIWVKDQALGSVLFIG